MSINTINIPGWQSFSPCQPHPNLLDTMSGHFYSPFGQTGWIINNPPKIKPSKPIAGWCSFYAFGRNINERKIISNAEILAKNISPPLDTYVVIDEGWCQWGNWNNPYTDKFPGGLKYLSQKITDLGLFPAIWIAPFLTDQPTKNRLKVLPYKYILDLENPDVFKDCLNSIETLIKKYKFKFLKLDFLYALHHLPKFTSGKIPDEILENFLSTIKKTYPEIHINACGCPLGPAIGNCDSMRISTDNFIPYLNRLWPINHLICSHKLNQLEKNLKSRDHTRRFWLLDPDVFSCRNSTGLNHRQISRLSSAIRKAHGLYFLGDDLSQLSKFQMKTYIKPLFRDIITP